jgi:hypothetical protein
VTPARTSRRPGWATWLAIVAPIVALWIVVLCSLTALTHPAAGASPRAVATRPAASHTAGRRPMAATPAPSPTSSAPVQRVVIVNPVTTSSSASLWQNPIITLIVGAVLGAGGSWLVAADERRHAAAERALERAAELARAKSAGRLARFQIELDLAGQRASQTAATVRSLHVLDGVLDGTAHPSIDIAHLTVLPVAFEESDLAGRLEALATNLARYGVCPPADRAAVADQLRTQIAAVLPDAQLSAAAYRDTLDDLRVNGRKQAADDAEADETAGRRVRRR